MTVKQIQALDQYAIERVGIPSLVLMENAGRAVAEEVCEVLRRKSKARVVVVCGTGNNGGDGLVAARHLWAQGVKTEVLIVGKKEDLKADPKVFYSVALKLGIPVTHWAGAAIFRKTDVIVDALFGVGLNRDIAEPYRSVIKSINESQAYVVACDIPSGLDGTTGKTYGCCVKADKTVTFTFLKAGFFRNAGSHYIGKAVVRPIGLPANLLKKIRP